MGQADAVIEVRPKFVYWVGMPSVLTRLDRVELLKSDMMISECSMEDLPGLANERRAIFLFNLDHISALNKSPDSGLQPAARNLSQLILDRCRGRCIVHTTTIDPAIAGIFISQKIPYVEKNFENRQVVLSAVIGISQSVFRDNSQPVRDHLRLNIRNFREFPCDIQLVSRNIHIQAHLHDISFSGVGIVAPEPATIKELQLRDACSLAFSLGNQNIRIAKAFLSRIDPESGSLGFSFDIKNPGMITDNDAYHLGSFVYGWLKEHLTFQQTT